jgi:glycosyltransferase involved in cell wall biosynthesis
MKILQLCKKFPYPLKDGESIAVTYLSKAMNEQGCEITLLAMNTTKHFTEVEKLPEDFNHYKAIHTTTLDNTLNPIDAFKNLFSKDSYHISRFVCESFKLKLIELLQNEEYDVVQLETLYLTPYIETIKQYSNAIVTMRAHNVEFEIWDRIANNTSLLPKKWYLKYLTKKLKNYELEHLNDYDYLVSVSERDLREFKKHGYKNGAMASPIGLDIKKYKTTDNFESGISFIGALDWIPNLEGLEWFLENVWPKLSKEMPKLKFHIAGRNTPEKLLNLNIPNVIVYGEVPDAVAFIDKYPVMIVPLFSGSGMRVKILEGMALSKIIVSTSLGKEGINAEDGKEILVANTVNQFIEKIREAVILADNGNVIGENAYKFLLEYYDHSMLAKKLISKYKHLIENPYPAAVN